MKMIAFFAILTLTVGCASKPETKSFQERTLEYNIWGQTECKDVNVHEDGSVTVGRCPLSTLDKDGCITITNYQGEEVKYCTNE